MDSYAAANPGMPNSVLARNLVKSVRNGKLRTELYTTIKQRFDAMAAMTPEQSQQLKNTQFIANNKWKNYTADIQNHINLLNKEYIDTRGYTDTTLKTILPKIDAAGDVVKYILNSKGNFGHEPTDVFTDIQGSKHGMAYALEDQYQKVSNTPGMSPQDAIMIMYNANNMSLPANNKTWGNKEGVSEAALHTAVNKQLNRWKKSQQIYAKINDIKNILDNLRKEKIASYNATITKADGFFKDENFDEAKSLYNKALSLFPNKEYPKNQLTEITKALEQKEYERQQQLLTDKKYKDAINEADKYFNSADYASAKAKYKLALTIKPKQNYPQDRIDKIDKLIQLQKAENLAAAQKERQRKIDAAKAGNAKNKDFDFTGKARGAKFLSDLARKYPEGITVENYNKPHKKIKRVIVNRNGIAKEYIQVKYSYGTYYFRNGRNISRYIFLSETKE